MFSNGLVDGNGIKMQYCSLIDDNMENKCKICSSHLNAPRVLSCLHVFCKSCLQSLLNGNASTTAGSVHVDSPTVSNSPVAVELFEGGKSGVANMKHKNFIECPTCEQVTEVGLKGVESLTCNYLLTNIVDVSTIASEQKSCTSCKSKEQPISHCTDCENFLCESCHTAHKYMRCFENHEVVKYEELRKTDKSLILHKTLYCNVHAAENLKYYCFNCQIPICKECLITNHKGSEHHYEMIALAEKSVRGEVEKLMKEAKAKVQYCDTAASNLTGALSELQLQKDSARDHIEDSYQKCKKILEKCRDESIAELHNVHSERELKVMDMLHYIENSMNKVESACVFTSRVLEQANASEFLAMKKVISTQFTNLLQNIPQCDINYLLNFESKTDKFKHLAENIVGKLRSEVFSPKERTPMMAVRSDSGNSGNSPITLPTSMPNSFDCNISVLGNNSAMSYMLTPDSPLQSQSSGMYRTLQPQQHKLLLTPTYNVGITDSDNTMVFTGNGINNLTSGSNGYDGTIAKVNGGVDNVKEINKMITGFYHDSMGQSRTLNGTGNCNASGGGEVGMAPYFNNNLKYALSHLNSLNYGTPAMKNNALMTSDNRKPNYNSLFPQNDVPVTDIMPGDQHPFYNLQTRKTTLNGNDFNSAAIVGRNKAAPMEVRCKFGTLGTSKGQFNSPHGFCLGVDEEIVVADTYNHRIEVFDKTGKFNFHFGVPGREEGQLWYPRKVTVIHVSGKFVVCDRGNERSRMQIFSKSGTFIRKITIRYIDIVAGLAVTSNGHIVAVDSVSPTVFVISEDGELMRWFDCCDYMREPSDIAIRGNDFYVCDFKGHCVAVFHEDGTFKYRIGNEKVTCYPNGIDVSNAGDILIGDSHGNRFHISCYTHDGILQSEYECPHVKVSRCCGLKITSEGYVVTLAKNNNHVLVLDTLYLQ